MTKTALKSRGRDRSAGRIPLKKFTGLGQGSSHEEILCFSEALRIVLQTRFALCESVPPIESPFLDAIRKRLPLEHRPSPKVVGTNERALKSSVKRRRDTAR